MTGAFVAAVALSGAKREKVTGINLLLVTERSTT